MDNSLRKNHFIVKAVFAFLAFFCALFFLSFEGRNGQGRYAITASAASGDVIAIRQYTVDMVVQTDRKIVVEEKITVEFLKDNLTMFYRSLPKESARYFNIQASCEGNSAFSYHVAENPDIDGFIDINCVGGAKRGNVWTYDIFYTMENGCDSGDGMIVDVIPFGFTVPLNDVTATVHFPTAISKGDYETYVEYGSTGTGGALSRDLSQDGKTLVLKTDRLSVRYNETFDEWVADGITLNFTLGKGVLKNYTLTRIFTGDMWKFALGGLGIVALATLALLKTRKNREIITVVNVKAPDDMDPMKMGKLLDGVADSEDVTSMIYYFAYKGYLTIDLTNENDPVFTRKVNELPSSEAVHARTLFNGLFVSGNSVSVSALECKFFQFSDKAIHQLPQKKMYERVSVFGYVTGALLGTFFAFLSGWLMGKFRIGGGYSYPFGGAFAIPAVLLLVLGAIAENYRYKWKRKRLVGMKIVQIAIALIFTAVYVFFMGTHVMTEYEKLVVCLFSFIATFLTSGALSRTKKYCDELGEILGFKDFIVVTEEEKIKFMLEENPELYYKILPYAQVLGVTDEWENKFAKITLPPPAWCTGTQMTYFDYVILHRCMSRAMTTAISRPKQSGGGSSIGRSGGGGSFGGFGGGGFGGGGGGAR